MRLLICADDLAVVIAIIEIVTQKSQKVTLSNDARGERVLYRVGPAGKEAK